VDHVIKRSKNAGTPLDPPGEILHEPDGFD
jgi:hypothetical protein